MPNTWQHGAHPQVGAHFKVRTDGAIHHHYDAVQFTRHAPPRSTIAIGIEFVNLAWVVVANPQINTLTPPTTVTDHSVRKLITGWNVPHPGTARKYVVPPAQQLEALYQLVRQLLFHFPSISADWLSLNPWRHPANVGHPNLNHPGYFLMSDWQGAGLPPLYNGAGALYNQPGIYCHQNIGPHADGSFQALYTWLRHYGWNYAMGSPLQAHAAYAVAVDRASNLKQIGLNWFADVTSYLPSSATAPVGGTTG